MYPLAILFMQRNNRPPKAPTVLDEEYEWVYGKGPRAGERRGFDWTNLS